MTSHLSRRTALRLGLGLGAAASLGTAQASVASAAGQIVRGSFISRYRNRQQTPWEIIYPAGHAPGSRLPVLIMLHGTDGDAYTPERVNFPAHSATMAAEGRQPYACVGVLGGNTWWHARADGTDSSAMIKEELLPMLAQRGLDTGRVALHGFSMGGVGAIWTAERYRTAALKSLVVSSCPIPSRWDEYPHSYDSPADFYAHDIRRFWYTLKGLPIRVDIAEGDPMYRENLAVLPSADPHPEFHHTWGGHDWDYWNRIAIEQFRYVADHF